MKRLMCLLVLLVVPVVGICEDVNDDKQTSENVTFKCTDITGDSDLDTYISVGFSEGTEPNQLKMSLWVPDLLGSNGLESIDVTNTDKIKYKFDACKTLIGDICMSYFTGEFSFLFRVPNTRFEALDISEIEAPDDVALTYSNSKSEPVFTANYTCVHNEDNESSDSITVE